MWTIYSIGDASFLEQVLTALAMISGTGELETVAAIGMVVGLIIMGFQSMIEGGGIKFQNLFVAWIVYAALFGGTATVVIEDVYSGTTKVVDNVPQGVAAGGSIVSSIGFKTTEIFEQAFGTIRVTENGFAYGLEVLSDIRRSMLSPSALRSANSPDPAKKSDVWKSWGNYIKECTMVGVDLGEYTVEQIQKNTRFPGQSAIMQLRFDSEAYGTKINVDGTPLFKNCTDAFGILKRFTETDFYTALKRRVSSEIGIDNPALAQTSVSEAMTALQQASVSAQEYMLSSAMEPIFQWSVAENERNFQRMASAAMLHTSIQQRNEAWAAEQALFNTMVRPMMTFFEGLIFAITPLMAFLIGLGPKGFSLIGKYLMIMLWIQLWMPVMAIVNLYIHMAAGSKLTALQSAQADDLPLTSFYGLHALDQTLQNYIATGSMLASSVPGITLMLIYGSAVTATSLAGKMSAGNAPTNNATPDLMQNGAVFTNDGWQSFNRTQGNHQTGAPQIMDNVKMGQGLSNAVSSSREEMQSAQQAFGAKVGQGFSQSLKSGESVYDRLAKKDTDTGSWGESERAAYNIGKSFLEDLGIGERFNKQETLAMGTSIAANAKTPGKGVAGAKAEATAAIEQRLGHDEFRQLGMSEKIDESIGKASEKSNSFTTALAKEEAQGKDNTFTEEFNLNKDQGYTDSAQRAVSASDKHSDATQMQRNFASDKQMNIGQMVQAAKLTAGQEGGALDQINDFYRNYGNQGYNADASHYADMAKRQYGMTDEDAALAGQILAISNGDPLLDKTVNEGAAEDSMEVMNALFGRSGPTNQDPNRNENIAGNTEDQVDQRVSPATRLDGPDGNPQQHEAETRANMATYAGMAENANPRDRQAEGQDVVDAHLQDKGTALAQRAAGKIGEEADKQVEDANGSVGGMTAEIASTLATLGGGDIVSNIGDEAKEQLYDNDPTRAGTTYQDFNAMDDQQRQEFLQPMIDHFRGEYEEMGFSPQMSEYLALESTSGYVHDNRENAQMSGSLFASAPSMPWSDAPGPENKADGAFNNANETAVAEGREGFVPENWRVTGAQEGRPDAKNAAEDILSGMKEEALGRIAGNPENVQSMANEFLYSDDQGGQERGASGLMQVDQAGSLPTAFAPQPSQGGGGPSAAEVQAQQQYLQPDPAPEQDNQDDQQDGGPPNFNRSF